MKLNLYFMIFIATVKQNEARWPKWTRPTTTTTTIAPTTTAQETTQMLTTTAPTSGCEVMSLIRTLPASCNSSTLDVGTCNYMDCGMNMTQRLCCSPTRFENVRIDCLGGPFEIQRTVGCGCENCNDAITVITGTLMARNASMLVPSIGSVISRNGLEITRTNAQGAFQFSIPPPTDGKIVITISHALPGVRFFTSVKLLNVGSSRRADFSLEVLSLPEVQTFPTSMSAISFTLADTGSGPIRVNIPANGLLSMENGSIYNGPVRVYSVFLNPTDDLAISVGPTQLLADGTPPRLMASYGLVQIYLYDFMNLFRLVAPNANIEIPRDYVSRPEDVTEIRLWKQNPTSGLFEEESQFTGARRRKRQTGNATLTAAINITDRLANLDVIVRPYCQLKIGAYTDNTFSSDLDNVNIYAIYRDVTTMSWVGYIQQTTNLNTGACLALPCTFNSSRISRVFFNAIHFGDDLEAVTSSPVVPANIGAPLNQINALNYTRLDQDNPSAAKTIFRITPPTVSITNDTGGAVFNVQGCSSKQLNAVSHFRFYKTSQVLEINRIDVDEFNIRETWRSDPLAWWPSQNNFIACYIKIQVQSGQGTQMEAVSVTQNREAVFGFRAVTITSDTVTACLEYKCPVTDDRTWVEVLADNRNCSFGNYNSALMNFLINDPAPALFLNQSFSMYAPQVMNLASFGLVTYTDRDPIVAKNNANTMCRDSSVPNAMRVVCG